MRLGLAGKVKVQIFKESTGELVEDRPWSSNMILDQGLDWFGNEPGFAPVNTNPEIRHPFPLSPVYFFGECTLGVSDAAVSASQTRVQGMGVTPTERPTTPSIAGLAPGEASSIEPLHFDAIETGPNIAWRRAWVHRHASSGSEVYKEVVFGRSRHPTSPPSGYDDCGGAFKVPSHYGYPDQWSYPAFARHVFESPVKLRSGYLCLVRYEFSITRSTLGPSDAGISPAGQQQWLTNGFWEPYNIGGQLAAYVAPMMSVGIEVRHDFSGEGNIGWKFDSAGAYRGPVTTSGGLIRSFPTQDAYVLGSFERTYSVEIGGLADPGGRDVWLFLKKVLIKAPTGFAWEMEFDEDPEDPPVDVGEVPDSEEWPPDSDLYFFVPYVSGSPTYVPAIQMNFKLSWGRASEGGS